MQLYASNEIMQPVIKKYFTASGTEQQKKKEESCEMIYMKGAKGGFFEGFFFCVCVFCVVFVVHLFVSSAPPVFEFLLKERVC